jgi:hypothetical protein
MKWIGRKIFFLIKRINDDKMMRFNNPFCNKISIKSYIKNQNLSNKAKFNYKFNVHFNFLLGLEFLLFVDILSFHFKRKYKDWRSLI